LLFLIIFKSTISEQHRCNIHILCEWLVNTIGEIGFWHILSLQQVNPSPCCFPFESAIGTPRSFSDYCLQGNEKEALFTFPIELRNGTKDKLQLI
jgi:hypothetical protein